MGTFNYAKSKNLITVGLDYTDPMAIEEDEIYHDDYRDIKEYLNKFEFNFYNLSLHIGYYEGFYIETYETEWACTSDDRKKKYKELNFIKKILIHLVNTYGLIAIEPAWCSRIYKGKEAIDKIKWCYKQDRKYIKFDAEHTEAADKMTVSEFHEYMLRAEKEDKLKNRI